MNAVTVVQILIVAVLFRVGWTLTVDAEPWQQLVASSLLALVWLQWLMIYSGRIK